MNSGIRNLESGCIFRYLFAGTEYLWYDTKNNRNEEEQRIEIGKKRDFTEKNLSVGKWSCILLNNGLTLYSIIAHRAIFTFIVYALPSIAAPIP